MATKKPDVFDSPVYTLGVNDWREELNRVAQSRTQQVRASQPTGGGAAAQLQKALSSLASDVQRRVYRDTEKFEKEQYQEKKALAKAAEADPMGFALKAAGVIPWDQAKPANFDQLPFSEQTTAYELYLGTAADQAVAVNPQLARDEVMANLRINNPAPVKPKGNVALDLGVGIAQGAFGTAQAVSDLIDPSSAVSEWARNVSDWMDEQKSDAAKNNVKEKEWARAKLSDEDRSVLGAFAAEAGIELKNMGVADVGNLLGNVLTSFGIAGGAAKLAARGAANAATASRVATGVGIGQAGVMAGGDATGSAFDGIMGLTDEEAARLPGWTTALEIAGGDPEQAKKQLALSAARMATLPGVAAGLGMSALPGSMERAFGRAFSPQELASTGFLSKARSYATAAGLEGAEEALTGVAGSVGEVTVNPEASLTEGRGSEFALGAVGGLLGRGISGRVAGRVNRKEEDSTQVDEEVEVPPTPINPTPVEPIEPAETFDPSARAVLQNRDRSDPNYVAQVRENSANIDPDLLAPGKLFGSGTPVIEEGMNIEASHLGVTDTATAADGTKFPVQYAVVEADSPLVSHDANGRAMPGYETGGEGISRVVAGNGRMAFLDLGYTNNTADTYRDALAGFLEQVDIDPTLATSMNKPVLVRVMPANLVTGNIGALSNLPEGSALSPSERATTDAGYIDIEGLAISDEGQFTPKSLIEFINSLPENERIGLMDGQVPSATAIERLRNAVFVKAYGDAELVRLQTQASDPDYKNILAALTRAAPAYARLAGQGEYDLRKVVADTTKAAFNARANGMTIGQYINQESLLGMEGDQRILRMIGDNIRSGKRIGDALTDLANRAYTESQKSEAEDLLGDTPVRIPVETLIEETMNVQPPVEPTQGELVPAATKTTSVEPETTPVEPETTPVEPETTPVEPAPVTKTPDTPELASPDEPTYEPAVAEISEEAKYISFTTTGRAKAYHIAEGIKRGVSPDVLFEGANKVVLDAVKNAESTSEKIATSQGVGLVEVLPAEGYVSRLIYEAANRQKDPSFLASAARALGVRIEELRKLITIARIERAAIAHKAELGILRDGDSYQLPSMMEMLYTNDVNGFTYPENNKAFLSHVLDYFGSDTRKRSADDKQLLNALSPSDFQYMMSSGWIRNPETSPNPRGATAFNSLGLMPRLNNMLFNPYVRESMTVKRSVALGELLGKMGALPPVEAQLLETIAQGYRNKGMPEGIPVNVSSTGNVLWKSDRVNGVFVFAPNTLGRIDLSGSTVTRTFAHELIHAVTGTVLSSDQKAPVGSKENNRAQAVGWVFRNVKRAARRVDVTGRGGDNSQLAYGLTDEYEMLAELTNPRFLTLLDAIELDLAKAPADVKQSLKDMGVTGDTPSIADTLLKIFESLLKAFSGYGFTKGNAAQAIAQIADFYKAETQRQVKEGKLTQLASTATTTLPDTGKFSLYNRASNPPTGGSFGAPTTPDAEVRDPFSSRETFGDVLEDMNDGIAARGATPMRDAVQGLMVGDFKRVRDGLASAMEKANEYFHDNMTPFNTWLNGLVQANFLPDALVTRVRGALYLAPGRRDAFMSDAMSKNGGNEINALIARLSTDTKQSIETVHKQVGYWLTAVRAPDANQQIINRLQREADRATETIQRLLDKADVKALTPTEAARLVDARKALAESQAEISTRNKALNNPDINVKEHEIGLAGGMNLAQAKALADSIEKRIPVKRLEEVAKHVYDLNAWRLALDIETGRTGSDRVAAFLELDDAAIKQMDDLRVAGINALGTNPTGDAYVKLNALRKEVAALVRSNYVPMTGNPLFEADADFLSGGSATPNVRDTKVQEGRQSIPDDGLTSTLNGVVQSSTYAGYQPFQAEIINAYNNMTPEARKEAKFGGRKITDGSQGIKENAIVVHLPDGTWEFTIGDGKAIASIRRANMDSNVTFLDKMSAPTRWFSYAAVQLQVFFGPKQFLRDGWEKSEILRTRDLYNSNGKRLDANRVGSQMVRNMLNPRLFKVAAQFAFDRTPQDSYEWQMMQELAGAGGLSGFSDRFARERSNVVANISKHKRLHSRAKDKVARVIDAYNRMFEIAPTLAAYTAMRGDGMSVQGAAAEALDLFNFRKKGSTMPFFTAIYAFAQPAVTGGANIASSLYNRKTGKWNTRVAIPRLVGYTISLLAIQSLARMMADDDEGGDIIDQQTDWTLSNTLPIQVGDGLVKIPLAFGLVRLANGMARGMLDVGSGEKTLSEASTGFVTGSVVPGFSPIDANEIDWTKRPLEALVATFAPTVAAPVLEVVANRTSLDAPVVNLNWEKRDEFRSDQYGKNIPEMWGEVARFMQRTFGMDLAPEQYRHLVRGYLIGTPGNILTETVENPFREERGYTVNNPFLSWIYAQPTEYAIKGQFYGYTEKAEELRREMLTAVKEGRSTDIATMSNADRQMVALLAQWDEVDKRFRSDKTKITKNPALTEAGKQARRKVLDDELLQFQRLYLQQYRLIEDKTTK